MTGDFVAAMTNCVEPAKCDRTHGIPRALTDYFYQLRWCGETIDLNKPASKSFQGWDCFAKGKPHPR